MEKDQVKKKRFDRTWIIDKAIELSIFVFGFVIALWIDGVRDDNQIKQLKKHYIEIVSWDLSKDSTQYSDAYMHDSLRFEGCNYVLSFLTKRQNAQIHSYGVLKHESNGRIGPGFDFDEAGFYAKNDTIEIIAEKKGWYLDTSGFWLNKQIIQSLSNEFDWFSNEINDSVKQNIEFYAEYVDETKSVFQHKTGYEGLMSQNTSSFMGTTEVESKLSDYYSKGAYISWLEDYYRNNHYPHFNELRYAYGHVGLFRFLYLINEDQNNELITQLTLAKIHANKEKGYYLEMLEMNNEIKKLIKSTKI